VSRWQKIWDRLRGNPAGKGSKEGNNAKEDANERALDHLDAALTQLENSNVPIVGKPTPWVPGSTVATASVEETKLDRLTRLGQSHHDANPEEARMLLRDLRRTPFEARALAAILTHAQEAWFAPLRAEVAAMLAERGEHQKALQIVSEAHDPPSLMLAADLLEADGKTAEALARVERTLLASYRYPGALERLALLRRRLGIRDKASIKADTTQVVPRTPSGLRIVGELGRGGSAVVYRAVEHHGKRQVALKMFYAVDKSRPLLRHEIQLSTRFAGPGVLPLFDARVEDGNLLYAIAEGGSLRGLQDRQRGAATVMAQNSHFWIGSLATTLARIHAAGWVHNDIKPSNVLLSHPVVVQARTDAKTGSGAERGLRAETWLSDFAIARRIGEPAPPGSVGYLSPERLAGRPSDPRDDVYAFGRVLEDLGFGSAESLNREDEGAHRTGDEEKILTGLQNLTQRCLGPDATRPAHGAALKQALAQYNIFD
jgi:eukaryotic-like serine/threonine-protein kinase